MMNQAGQLETEWIRALIAEAERDLVFLWHIAGGKFGGPTYAQDELPLVISRVSAALIAAGCSAGFGEPGSTQWYSGPRI